MRLKTLLPTLIILLMTMAAVPQVDAGEAAAIQPSCPTPREVQGFLTCADVAKAEAEGAVVYYSPDVERQLVAVLEKFHELFPKIKTDQYLREQTGRLYAKLNAERQAGTYLADVLALSDYAPGLDLLKKDGYVPYVSPQVVNFGPRGRPAGAESAFSIRTVYPYLSRDRPDAPVNVWPVRINRRVFLGDFVQYLVEWEDRELVVRRPPQEQFDEGEGVYLAVEPEYCVLLEG
jgi:hypothetical protein